ncbi:LytR/AlgR family response regulator transcription factor [Algoriphagus hitonicola]|uniref:Two component transcriptional regulator, LytTR family n=1 Tax=Algoriphagus hitonicola TaxID=435880 RepID=A0A1I2RHG4_9BACT|nr:LytTR family DNA-binding domain-containing protein [Algoriphagus hitonicola]SFG38939.1 two component transcriptional regulator, LytTR family [Algoriphagus hitonicola]
MIKSIAIDDETYALEVIKSLAERVPFIEIESTFTNAIEGLEYVKNNPVQLVFLDINMPDISGIDVATLLPKDVLIVFTTAYSEFAVQGFELDALDYLLKPFSLSRFLKACQKAQEWIDLNPASDSRYTFVKTAEGQIRIDFDELHFCEAQGNYVTFQSKSQKAVSRMTLTEVETILPAYFIRSHRSYLVNKHLVQKIERHQVWVGSHKVPVSGSYYQDLVDKV